MTSKLLKGWKKVTLGSISKKRTGMYGINAPAVDYLPTLYRYLRITDINDDGTLNNEKKVSVDIKKTDDSKYLLEKNDIVLARTGASVGRSYFYDGSEGDMIFAGFLIKYSIDPAKVVPEFIKYFFQSNSYKNWVQSVSTGSTRPNINAKMYNNLEIILPPKEIQIGLVNYLSLLDNKIEINNQINENLEAQAQALFKHWFVDFEFPNEEGLPYKASGGEMIETELGLIPKDWEWKGLKDVATLTMGLSPKSATYNHEEIGLPLLNGAADFENGKIKPKRYTSKPTRITKKGDLVFCIRATIGNIDFADKEYCIGRGVAAITPDNEKYKSIIYYTLDNSIKQLIAQASGSVILGLKKTDINNMNILHPKESILSKFSKTINKFFEIKKNKEEENERLAELRDTLLPKLMNGELRIPLD